MSEKLIDEPSSEYGDPFKELAVAVLESVLRSYREPNKVLYPAITKEQFVAWMQSDSCHFYEEILEWEPGTYYTHIKNAGILSQIPQNYPRKRVPLSVNDKRRARNDQSSEGRKNPTTEIVTRHRYIPADK